MLFTRKIKSGFESKQIEYLEQRLADHVAFLSQNIGARNLGHYSALVKASEYIFDSITAFKFCVEKQEYSVTGKAVHNLILEKKGTDEPDEIFILGAHYDTVLDSPGADDNATGIAALLEIIRLLEDYQNQKTIRFVAFTLEEPPFFGTDKMGSMAYAKKCRENQDNIIGMVAFEMLGYFSEEPNSQEYPLAEMKMAYPERGNFIGVVGNKHSEKFTEAFVKKLKDTSLAKVEFLIANSFMPGVDLSDHASFWKYDYPALMLTDTAFFRNPYYHTAEDKIDHLNFKKFARLVLGLNYTLRELDQTL